MKKPFILAFTGLDASGKASQSKLLYEALIKKEYKTILVDFPQYHKWHSFLVRLYLKGRFAKDANKVNPYIASLFYAIDRFFAYYTHLKREFKDMDFVIFDRYVESNMIFQGLKANNNFTGKKFDDNKKLQKILRFIENLEYKIMHLPRPDTIFVLDVSVEHVIKNLNTRGNKLDSHENVEIQLKAYDTLHYLTNKYNWKFINCMDNCDTMKSKQDIHYDILVNFINELNK